jgi:hypothetical protein
MIEFNNSKVQSTFCPYPGYHFKRENFEKKNGQLTSFSFSKTPSLGQLGLS